MTPFTLACVMVKGDRNYTPVYVERLRSMVARHTRRPFDTVCLTDQPDKMPGGVRAVIIKRPRKPARAWWAKINLFDPAMPFSERVLYLDLDVLAVGDLDPIIDYPAEFAIAPDSAPDFKGNGARRTVKGYQSSCMVWAHRARPQFFTAFRADMTRRLWGDQDMLKEVSPDEKMFPASWFSRLRPAGPQGWGDDTKVVLCVKVKNAVAQDTYPWFKDYWF